MRRIDWARSAAVANVPTTPRISPERDLSPSKMYIRPSKMYILPSTMLLRTRTQCVCSRSW